MIVKPPQKDSNDVWLFLDEVNHIKTEREEWLPESGRRGMGSSSRYRASVLQDESSLCVDCGDSCKTLSVT